MDPGQGIAPSDDEHPGGKSGREEGDNTEAQKDSEPKSGSGSNSSWKAVAGFVGVSGAFGLYQANLEHPEWFVRGIKPDRKETHENMLRKMEEAEVKLD